MTTKKKKIADNNENSSNHAWRYFELHAGQRISLIRYFVIVLSLYVTGSSYLIAKFSDNGCMEEYSVIIFSGIFILITIIFWLLDNRSRKLIHIAERSLRRYEREGKEDYTHKIFISEKKSACCTIRHTHCFRALFIIAILSALLIAYCSWNRMCISTGEQPTTMVDKLH